MNYDVELGGQSFAVKVRQHPDGGWWVKVGDGAEVRWEGDRWGAAEWWLRQGSAEHRVGAFVQGDRVAVQLAGQGLVGTVTDARDKALSKGSGAQEGVVATPMPGLVVRVPVVEGQDVHTGQVLVVVEAMKMENEYKSPFDGRIAKVHVPAGVAVEAGTVLVTVEPA